MQTREYHEGKMRNQKRNGEVQSTQLLTKSLNWFYCPCNRPPPHPTTTNRTQWEASYRDAVALSDVGAQYAGHHAADVQQRHAGAPAIVAGRLALHAGEAEEAAAACGRQGRSAVKFPCFTLFWHLVKCCTGA